MEFDVKALEMLPGEEPERFNLWQAGQAGQAAGAGRCERSASRRCRIFAIVTT
jgi:hypothetical protein